MDQPGKVANPARGELNRENEHSPVIKTFRWDQRLEIQNLFMAFKHSNGLPDGDNIGSTL